MNTQVSGPKKLSEVSLADVAASDTQFDVAKAGNREKVKDTLEFDIPELVEIVSEDIDSNKGFVKAFFGIQVVTAGKPSRPGGIIPVSLPLYDPNNMIPELRLNQAATFFHRFLAAIQPTTYKVAARIDRSTSDWRYFDAAGKELSHPERKARAKEINSKIHTIAMQFAEGKITFMGERAVVVKARNKDASKQDYPYFNWYEDRPESYIVRASFAASSADDDSTPF